MKRQVRLYVPLHSKKMKDMIRVDIVCPLYHADDYIDRFLEGLAAQKEVTINDVVFAITVDGTPTDYVTSRIEEAGYTYFEVPSEKFSHSLTREKAIREYCTQKVVVMMSQDVILRGKYALRNLASAIMGDVVYAYGRQTVRGKTIERYIRETNYADASYIVGKEDVEKLQLKTFFASDAFSAYHRPTFLRLGGYGGGHMMMNEDMLYAKRIIEAGYKKAYISSAIVEHSHKFKLKQLYKRYYETGVWFAEHPEFSMYKTTDSGISLAKRVFVKAVKHMNIPVLFRFLPDMAARYLGMRRGRSDGIALVAARAAKAAEELTAQREVAGYIPAKRDNKRR